MKENSQIWKENDDEDSGEGRTALAPLQNDPRYERNTYQVAHRRIQNGQDNRHGHAKSADRPPFPKPPGHRE